jgi:subtilisin
MRHKLAVTAAAAFALLLLLPAGNMSAGGTVQPGPEPPKVQSAARDRAARDGHARVIVELTLTTGRHVAEGLLRNAADVIAQRNAIAAASSQLLLRLPAGGGRLVRRFQTVPYVALDVSAAGLDTLENAPQAASVHLDGIARPVLADSVPLVQGDQVWASGYDGTGTMIAVLDTGVDSTHPFLAGKVTEEACYSSTVAGVSRSFCPNGQDEQIGPGAAAPCSAADCFHGTHVAGIAAGNGSGAGVPFSGVARGAQLMAVQVFSEIIDTSQCPNGIVPCAGAFESDVIAGLERVYQLSAQHNFAAVNISLGGALFSAPCDDEPYKPGIDNLRSIGIATVVAAGNQYSGTSLTTPACVSSAVSVGATTKADEIAFFSDINAYLSLLAPGDSITSSVPGGGYMSLSGTSMASPHVAGAWGLIKQAVPGGSVSAVLAALRQTGLPVVDDRFLIGSGLTMPRIRVFQALANLTTLPNPIPTATTLSPARARAGTGPVTLTITGSGFDAFSVVQWNGASRPTTVVNTHTLTTTLSTTDLQAPGTSQVRVVNPAPGGGISTSLVFSVDPPPTLTISAAKVGPGGSETVTLNAGYGGAQDWLALAPVGSGNTSYLQWTYVGAGVTTRQWTVTMPSTPGNYEFRLFLNGGYTIAATSPPVTVDSSISAAPAVTSLSPSQAIVGGAAFTLTVNGSGFASSSVVQWNGSNRPTTFVSATQLQAGIGAADIAALGTAQVAVQTPPPGGGTSSSVSFPITAPPALSVSATNVAPGAAVTVTLTNGLGGAGDWLALAATTAANTGYLQYTYVGAGVTTRTWTVNMPATAGTYEFRLFLNNGYTRAATSPTITVQSATAPSPTLTVSTTTAAPGAAVTVTLTDGAGGSTDWLALAATTAANTSYIQFTYVGAGVTTRTWTVNMPATAGTYEFRLFLNNGYTRAATSPTITVQSTTAPSPTLTVNTTTAAPGAPVTVTLKDGAGGSTDWLALAATTAANTSYIQYTYVGAGVTTRTWTVNMPATAGTYEFRLFLNNGYTRAATSPPVTVSP